MRTRSQAAKKLTYGNGRYEVKRQEPAYAICLDTNLNRNVCIHWVASRENREIVRQRLVALQSVQSPNIVLVYDMVDDGDRVGIVEEDLPDAADITADNRIKRLYEFCAGLAALHDRGLAHGKLDEHCFRRNAPGQSRLCNLAFGRDYLDKPEWDRLALITRLEAMGAGKIEDAIWQSLGTLVKNLSEPLRTGALRDRLKALLLHDRHRALVYTSQGRNIELGANKRSLRLTHPLVNVGFIKIDYDSTRFFVAEVSGEVLINNLPFNTDQELPQSCVIVLGNSSRPYAERYSITFDQSHPEVA